MGSFGRPIVLNLYDVTDADSLAREAIIAICARMDELGYAELDQTFKLEDMLMLAYKRWKRLNNNARLMKGK